MKLMSDVLTQVMKDKDLAPKTLEQKVFRIWNELPNIPNNMFVPVKLDNGVLRVITEYPALKSGVLIQKSQLINAINDKLDPADAPLKDMRIDVRQIQKPTYTPPPTQEKVIQPPEKKSPRDIPPHIHEHINFMLSTVDNPTLKKSLRKLFLSQYAAGTDLE